MTFPEQVDRYLKAVVCVQQTHPSDGLTTVTGILFSVDGTPIILAADHEETGPDSMESMWHAGAEAMCECKPVSLSGVSSCALLLPEGATLEDAQPLSLERCAGDTDLGGTKRNRDGRREDPCPEGIRSRVHGHRGAACGLPLPAWEQWRPRLEADGRKAARHHERPALPLQPWSVPGWGDPLYASAWRRPSGHEWAAGAPGVRRRNFAPVSGRAGPVASPLPVPHRVGGPTGEREEEIANPDSTCVPLRRRRRALLK